MKIGVFLITKFQILVNIHPQAMYKSSRYVDLENGVSKKWYTCTHNYHTPQNLRAFIRKAHEGCWFCQLLSCDHELPIFRLAIHHSCGVAFVRNKCAKTYIKWTPHLRAQLQCIFYQNLTLSSHNFLESRMQSLGCSDLLEMQKICGIQTLQLPLYFTLCLGSKMGEAPFFNAAKFPPFSQLQDPATHRLTLSFSFFPSFKIHSFQFLIKSTL